MDNPILDDGGATVDRRALLRKAAAAGAVAWTAPVVVSNPAFAQTVSDVAGNAGCTAVITASATSVPLAGYETDDGIGNANTPTQTTQPQQSTEWYGLRIRIDASAVCAGADCPENAVAAPVLGATSISYSDVTSSPAYGAFGGQWFALAGFPGPAPASGGTPLAANELLFRLRGEANGNGSPVIDELPAPRTGSYSADVHVTVAFQCPLGPVTTRTVSFRIQFANGAWSFTAL